MKLADRLKFTANGTSAAAISVGAAVAACRTLAQAIADGALVVGDTNVPFTVTDGTNWEDSLFTVTSGTVLTRSSVLASSAGGTTAATFSGPLTVFNAASAQGLSDGLVNPLDPGFDIVLCAGQSNMVGMGGSNVIIDVPDPRVFQFGTYPSDTATYQKITTGVEPLKWPYESKSSVSPASWFSRTYAGMIPSNRKVLLVPVARGGMHLVASPAEWGPGNPGGEFYENAIAQCNAAIAFARTMYPNSRFVGTIWLQGESDALYANQAQYVTPFKALIAGFRSRITEAANSFFIVGGLLPESIATSGSGFAAIAAAHQQTVAETPKCAYVPGVAGHNWNGDGLHYDDVAARIMGCGMASAVPQAKLATGVIIPASAVTLARSAASGYVGSPVTITVGTDNPLTGAQTESVQLSSNVAGTFSVNPVSLAAGVLSAASVFTPSTAGSATITGTATGTPSLTAGTIGYTSNAITAPAQMAAPVAASGIQSAGITLTAPSNGGSAITAYTVTSSPAGGVDSAAGTTALTRTITGLAAGTAYTFTATATNTVGTSVASPASNSVTPTASATVPGAPTIGAATAGDTTASFAFTAPASNGGTTIDTYQLTVYKSSDNTSVGTFNGATSPINATGLTDGTGYYGKIAAHNSVGYGAQSAASTTVIPVIPAAQSVRFAQFANMHETSATPPYAYASDGASYYNAPQGGTSTTALASDGSITVQVGNGAGKPMLGLKTSSALASYTGIPYLLFADTTDYHSFGTVSGTAGTTGIAVAAGDWMRLTRTGSTIVAYVSKDSGTTWATICTWTGVAAGTMYAQILAEATGTIISTASSGWA